MVDGEDKDDNAIEAPRELYPDIVDPGLPSPNSLHFGVLMPLNLSNTTDQYWRQIVVGEMSVRRAGYTRAVVYVATKHILTHN